MSIRGHGQTMRGIEIEELIRIIRMLMEERHKFLLEELRQLARDKG